MDAQSNHDRRQDGAFTLLGALSSGLCLPQRPELLAQSHYNSTACYNRRFSAELFPAHSPLRRESLLLFCPGLNDMLKLSPCSCCGEAQKQWYDVSRNTHNQQPLRRDPAKRKAAPRSRRRVVDFTVRHAEVAHRNSQTRACVVHPRPHHNMALSGNPRPQGAFEGLVLEKICNSHQVSPFAAFVIDIRAETLNVTSCMGVAWVAACDPALRQPINARLQQLPHGLEVVTGTGCPKKAAATPPRLSRFARVLQ